jgi:hypothetical protein
MADFIDKEAPSEFEAVVAACRALKIEENQAQIKVLRTKPNGRVLVRVAKPGTVMPAEWTEPEEKVSPPAFFGGERKHERKDRPKTVIVREVPTAEQEALLKKRSCDNA